jgi:hypothetical protein
MTMVGTDENSQFAAVHILYCEILCHFVEEKKRSPRWRTIAKPNPFYQTRNAPTLRHSYSGMRTETRLEYEMG